MTQMMEIIYSISFREKFTKLLSNISIINSNLQLKEKKKELFIFLYILKYVLTTS